MIDINQRSAWTRSSFDITRERQITEQLVNVVAVTKHKSYAAAFIAKVYDQTSKAQRIRAQQRRTLGPRFYP